jgi:hypothetical protein
MRYTDLVSGELWWDDEDAAHIRSRSVRYPGAENIEPGWTLDAAPTRLAHRVVRDPDPSSRAGCIRIIGVLAGRWVRAHRDRRPGGLVGVTAWKMRGADLRDYLEGKEAAGDRHH